MRRRFSKRQSGFWERLRDFLEREHRSKLWQVRRVFRQLRGAAEQDRRGVVMRHNSFRCRFRSCFFRELAQDRVERHRRFKTIPLLLRQDAAALDRPAQGAPRARATAAAKRRLARCGVPWRSAFGPAGWFCIRQRRRSSTARIRTGAATIRSSRLTSSAIAFGRERQPGVVVAMARPSCLRRARRR